MTTFLDKLRPGSFRGVPFRVFEHEGDGGRRLASHEYPQRDVAFHEDLGLRLRRFTVDAYVIGVRFAEERDALIQALEKKGPGPLIHPWRGRLDVVCDGFRYRESATQGGFVRFQLSFLEAGENRFPQAAVDTGSEVNRLADDAKGAVAQDFARRWDVSGPAFLEADASRRLGGLAGSLRDVRVPSIQGLLQSGTDVFEQNLPAQIRDGLATGTAGLNLLSLGIGLAGGARQFTGGSPVDAILGLLSFGEIGRAVAAVRGFISGVDVVSGFFGGPSETAPPLPASQSVGRVRLVASAAEGFAAGEEPVPSTTATRRRQLENRAALDDLVKTGVAVEMARAGAGLDFDSVEDATAWRDEVDARLDERRLGAGDDVFDALTDLRAAAIRDINTRAADLPRLRSVTPPATTPALVLAYRIFETADRDAEIVARNRIRHPGFVPGGQRLQVRVDG